MDLRLRGGDNPGHRMLVLSKALWQTGLREGTGCASQRPALRALLEGGCTDGGKAFLSDVGGNLNPFGGTVVTGLRQFSTLVDDRNLLDLQVDPVGVDSRHQVIHRGEAILALRRTGILPAQRGRQGGTPSPRAAVGDLN